MTALEQNDEDQDKRLEMCATNATHTTHSDGDVGLDARVTAIEEQVRVPGVCDCLPCGFCDWLVVSHLSTRETCTCTCTHAQSCMHA